MNDINRREVEIIKQKLFPVAPNNSVSHAKLNFLSQIYLKLNPDMLHNNYQKTGDFYRSSALEPKQVFDQSYLLSLANSEPKVPKYINEYWKCSTIGLRVPNTFKVRMKSPYLKFKDEQDGKQNFKLVTAAQMYNFSDDYGVLKKYIGK